MAGASGAPKGNRSSLMMQRNRSRRKRPYAPVLVGNRVWKCGGTMQAERMARASLAALLVAACSHAPANIQEAARQANCDIAAVDSTTVTMIRSTSATCRDSTHVAWFPTNEARD